MRKAQFAMEYLLVVGFSLLIIIPLIVLLSDSFEQQKQDVHTEHLSEIAREIVFQAEKLYYQGAPSTTTIQVTYPPYLSRAEIIIHEGVGIAIEYQLENVAITILAESKVPLEGTLNTHQGLHTLTLRVDDGNDSDPTNDVVTITDN